MDMKKQYIIPSVEVLSVSTVLMQAFGEASMPHDPFSSAPRRKTDVF